MATAGDELLGPRAQPRAAGAPALLRRVELPIPDAVEHLVGLQGQAPVPPYYGLWSRLEGFDPHELGRLLTDREAVRLTLWRATCTSSPSATRSGFARSWGRSSSATTTARSGGGWAASRGPAASSTLSRRSTRSSCAIWPPFGPASVMDVQNWSGLTKLNAVIERLRPAPDLPRRARQVALRPARRATTGPDTPAPVRFVGEYDNVLLGHADRRRLIPEDFPWRAMLATAASSTTCSSMACCGRCGGSSERESAARRWPFAPSGALAADDRDEVAEEPADDRLRGGRRQGPRRARRGGGALSSRARSGCLCASAGGPKRRCAAFGRRGPTQAWRCSRSP